MEIKFYLSLNLVGCDIIESFTLNDVGIDQQDWEDMTEKERADDLQDFGQDWVNNNCEWGWTIDK